jgi:O-antigen ligase
MLAPDLTFQLLAAIPCLAAAIYFFFKHPCANMVMAMTLTFFGGAPILPGISCAKLAVPLILFTLFKGIYSCQSGLVTRSVLASWKSFRHKSLTVVCIVIWFKIVAETIAYGLDGAAPTILKTAFINTFMPLGILMACLASQPTRVVVRDILIGLIAFPTIVVISLIPWLVTGGALRAVWTGDARLEIPWTDAINTCRLFCYAALGFLGWLASRNFKKKWFIVAASGFLGSVTLMYLTGTRQYLAFLVPVFIILLGTKWRGNRWLSSILALAVIAGLAAYVQHTIARQGSLGETGTSARMSETDLSGEFYEGRGQIWLAALEEGIANPFSGVGFANFGDHNIEYQLSDGRVIVLAETAHGVVQDVFAEHGMLLGITFGLLLLRLLAGVVTGLFTKIATPSLVLQAILLVIVGAGFLSGIFANATGVFMLLAVSWLQGCGDRAVAGLGSFSPKKSLQAGLAQLPIKKWGLRSRN